MVARSMQFQFLVLRTRAALASPLGIANFDKLSCKWLVARHSEHEIVIFIFAYPYPIRCSTLVVSTCRINDT